MSVGVQREARARGALVLAFNPDDAKDEKEEKGEEEEDTEHTPRIIPKMIWRDIGSTVFLPTSLCPHNVSVDP